MRRNLFVGKMLVFVVALSGCADNKPGNNTNAYQSDCEESNVSGHYLTVLGSFSTSVAPGASVELRAMVVHLDDGSETLGGVVEGKTVDFQIISVLGDGQLSAPTAVTNGSGVASVTFTANEAENYQITASAEGTCPVTFTVKVEDPLISLEVVGPNPVISETNRQISLQVHAFSINPGFGESPLVGETVTFELGTGGSGTTLTDVSGQVTSTSVSAETNPSGIAVVKMITGTQVELNGVDVTATLQGTAPVVITVRIQESGSGPCETNVDCPPEYPKCDGGTCVENPAQTGTCVDSNDCLSPYICVGGNCVAPGGSTPCNLMLANPCPTGEFCVAGYCQEIPGPCTNNDDCPVGWICLNGTCVQDTPAGETPCIETGNCQTGYVCVGGICVPENDCTNPEPPTRLHGTWSFNSLLHLRDALSGFVSGLLSAMEVLRDIIEGNLEISGVPGFVEDFIELIVGGLIDAYIPPWGQELIVALGDISDLLEDMRVYHTVNLIAQGNYEYYGTQTWDIVEFEFKGQPISEDPANISYLSNMSIEDFTSREICGIFFIDRYHVNNVVGGLVRWAIEAALTAVTCSVPGWPCYYSLQDALDDLIDCAGIASEIDSLVSNSFGISVYSMIESACNSLKQSGINALIQALNNIEVQLNLMSLRGRADIASDTQLQNGRWYGTLAGGNYDGDFSAVKQ